MRLAHRVHTRATPAQVWEVLGDPARWPQFDAFTRRVRGAHGPAVAGQRLVAVARVGSVRIPVDVVEAVAPRRLVLLVHTAPGLRQQVAFDVTAAVRGGCDITASVVVEGPLARPAVLPLHLASGVTARLLAARADRLSRAAERAA